MGQRAVSKRRPQDGQTRRRFLRSSAFFCRPAMVISQPAESVPMIKITRCSAMGIAVLSRVSESSNLLARVRMRLEVQLAAAAIGYVGVELGRGEIGVPEHLLDGAEVGAAFEQVRCE